jgi:hypothetical protein
MDSYSAHSAALILHPSFTKGCRELESALLRAEPGSIIFLVGLPGSGKTWIRHTVARNLYGNPARWPAGKVPFVEIMSLLADRGYFSTKDLAVSLLEQINAPSIDWLYRDPAAPSKQYAQLERDIGALAESWKKEQRPLTEWQAWRSSISSGRARQVKVVAIEHASLMVQNRVNGDAVQHTLNLMSMATSMGSSVLLTTTPDGYELWSGYAEICRRATYVLLEPYDLGNRRDRRNFGALVKALSRDLSFEPQDLPLKLLDAIGHATRTTPGGVHKILQAASQAALARDSAVITRKDLQCSFPSPFAINNLIKSEETLRDLTAPFEHSSFQHIEESTE